MKFKLVYKLKDGREISTIDISSDDIHGDGDLLRSLINDKNNNSEINVRDKNGQEIKTTFSEVESVEIIFV